VSSKWKIDCDPWRGSVSGGGASPYAAAAATPDLLEMGFVVVGFVHVGVQCVADSKYTSSFCSLFTRSLRSMVEMTVAPDIRTNRPTGVWQQRQAS
jgi:hypothetical protein